MSEVSHVQHLVLSMSLHCPIMEGLTCFGTQSSLLRLEEDCDLDLNS